MKKISRLHRSADRHWVGDGFPVRTLFSYGELGEELSPFLLLDHAGPAEFPPSDKRRGVGPHPHRGFETVTLVHAGEVEHRDTAGNEGRIGPGDVQWMTAASGVLHEEMHGREFTARGGTLEMVQLWVNLPARSKMSPPRYQTLLDRDIPAVALPGGGRVRVVAGELAGRKGPAKTFTPIQLWDVRLGAGEREELSVPAGDSTALVVLAGEVAVNGAETVREAELALFEREGTTFTVEARSAAKLVLLSGEPIREPIAGYGPFVMNTEQEIRQAMADFSSGKLGRLARR